MLCHNFLITRVRTYAPWYHGTLPWYGTYTCMRVRTRVPMVPTTVWPYTCTNITLSTLSQKRLEIQALRCNGDTLPWYGTYTCMRVRTRVPTTVWPYTCTNITLSQKQLEIQALRCNGDTSGRCQHRRHHGTRVPWYTTVTNITLSRRLWLHS